MVMFTFSVLDFFLQVLFKKSAGILMLPDSSPRDLKPVAFLLLAYKAVLHAFFVSFILSH